MVLPMSAAMICADSKLPAQLSGLNTPCSKLQGIFYRKVFRLIRFARYPRSPALAGSMLLSDKLRGMRSLVRLILTTEKTVRFGRHWTKHSDVL
jgi:hypothetical protein